MKTELNEMELDIVNGGNILDDMKKAVKKVVVTVVDTTVKVMNDIVHNQLNEQQDLIPNVKAVR